MIYRARAPAKLILTGEHSVVYGTPAIVSAVQLFTNIEFETGGSRLRTFLTGISSAEYPHQKLKRLKNKLDQHFNEFLQGSRAVQNILHRPDDLLIYTLASFGKRLPFGKIKTFSDLPLGAGMGSSAAAIAATLLIYEQFSGNICTLQERFQRIRFCERLQHGKGSAIDAAAVTFGGLQKVENDIATQIQNFDLSNFYYVLHGIPHSSTGECVAAVRYKFSNDIRLWEEFAAIGREFFTDPKNAIRANQMLLERIGVVPAAAKKFICEWENMGAVAKISGAGSIRGDFGGMVLIYQPDTDAWNNWRQHNPHRFAGKLVLAKNGAEYVQNE